MLALFAEEGLWCDVASGGELHLALDAGFDPASGSSCTATPSPTRSSRWRSTPASGLIVIDNFDEIDRLRAPDQRRSRGPPQAVLIRVTPDVSGETHEKISTGQADSKFGFSIADAPAAIARIEGIDGLDAAGLHAHIGSQLFELEPFRREVAALGELRRVLRRTTSAAGSASPTPRTPRPPAIEEYVGALARRRARAWHRRRASAC